MKKVQLLQEIKRALRAEAHRGRINNHYANSGGKATSPYFGGKMTWDQAAKVMDGFIAKEEERIQASREKRGLDEESTDAARASNKTRTKNKRNLQSSRRRRSSGESSYDRPRRYA